MPTLIFEALAHDSRHGVSSGAYGPVRWSQCMPPRQPVGQSLTGHNYLGHNYLGHHYLGHNYSKPLGSLSPRAFMGSAGDADALSAMPMRVGHAPSAVPMRVRHARRRFADARQTCALPVQAISIQAITI